MIVGNGFGARFVGAELEGVLGEAIGRSGEQPEGVVEPRSQARSPDHVHVCHVILCSLFSAWSISLFVAL